MSLWQRWRPWLRQERVLLVELATMLLMALVIGVYFLEHFSARLEEQQRQELTSLARQTALRAAESMVGDDLISLNVIARETRALDTVSEARFLGVARQPLAGGELPSAATVRVEVPVALADGEPAGALVLAARPSTAREGLESGYVLVVLGVLLLRVAGEVMWRRIQRGQPAGAGDETPGTGLDSDEAEALDGAPPSIVFRRPQGNGGPGGSDLRLSIVNFDHFRQRYTADALRALLDDYHHLLSEVARLYGGQVERGLGDRALVRFPGQPLSSTSFAALCAGLLFLRLTRLQGPRRKSHQAPALEFKALVCDDFGEEESWALCVAGVPGRLQVPESQLTRGELDVKALYQPERALTVMSGERQVRLQPVEQLAYRYQALLRSQAEAVMGDGLGSGPAGEDGVSPSR